jgi:hypothetical protein
MPGKDSSPGEDAAAAVEESKSNRMAYAATGDDLPTSLFGETDADQESFMQIAKSALNQHKMKYREEQLSGALGTLRVVRSVFGLVRTPASLSLTVLIFARRNTTCWCKRDMSPRRACART